MSDGKMEVGRVGEKDLQRQMCSKKKIHGSIVNQTLF
jgi:hypothetical protein